MDPCQARCLDRIDSPTLDGTSLPVMAGIGWSRQTHRWKCCCWLPTCDSSWYIHPDGWDSCWWGSCCAWSSMPWLDDSCWLLCCNFAWCALWALWSDWTECDGNVQRFLDFESCMQVQNALWCCPALMLLHWRWPLGKARCHIGGCMLFCLFPWWKLWSCWCNSPSWIACWGWVLLYKGLFLHRWLSGLVMPWDRWILS